MEKTISEIRKLIDAYNSDASLDGLIHLSYYAGANEWCIEDYDGDQLEGSSGTIDEVKTWLENALYVNLKSEKSLYQMLKAYVKKFNLNEYTYIAIEADGDGYVAEPEDGLFHDEEEDEQLITFNSEEMALEKMRNCIIKNNARLYA